MATFTLKSLDTRPIFEVTLRNPDGTVHDLTGSTSWKLHVKLPSGLVFTRDLVKQGLDTAGTLRYTWVATDWDTGNLPVPVGAWKTYELQMEYEVIGGTSRMTFPNDGFDVLHIYGGIA